MERSKEKVGYILSKFCMQDHSSSSMINDVFSFQNWSALKMIIITGNNKQNQKKV